MWNHSSWELLHRGGPIMWLLLGVSVLAGVLLLDRLLAFLWAAERFSGRLHRIRAVVDLEDWDRLARYGWRRTPMVRLARAFAAVVGLPADRRQEAMQREAELILGDLEKRLRWLAIVGQVSPMLGLLGTVTGLVSAFHQVELLGGQVRPSDLANGIWEALLTTVFGLAIAVPALVAYNALSARLDRIARHLTVLASYLEEWTPPSNPPADGKRRPPRHVTSNA